MAWKRYITFTISERVQFNNQYKLRNKELRKQTTQVKTVFKAILLFSRRHIECKDGMRHLVKTIDRHNERLTFKKWCNSTKHRRENHLFSTEKGVVSNLDRFVDEIGTL